MILVTGATGFLGSHVADALLARGQRARLLDEDGHTWRDYFAALCRALDLPMPARSIPRSLAYGLGALMEWGGHAVRRHQRPLLTRMAVELLGTRQGFSGARARERLGFVPRVTFDDGVARTVAWLRTRNVG